MSDRDFFREVDEAVRQEQFKKLWDRYGIFIIVLAVLLIAAVAGYKGWSTWRQRTADETGAQFMQGMNFAHNDDPAKAKEIFSKLAEQGPRGYSLLSRFQLAEADADSGDKDKAVAGYDAIANEAGVDPILKDYAVIQAGTLKVDSADYAEMQKRLSGLVNDKNPWRYSARELLGLSAYKAGNMSEASNQFSALLADQGTPSGMRERADVMMTLITSAPQSLSSTAK